MQKLLLTKTVFYFVFLFLPLALWIWGKGMSFSDLNIFALGEILGVASLSLFAGVFVLSFRNSLFDRLFEGLNNLYRTHIFSAQLALVFAVLHVLFLLGKYSNSLSEALDFLWFPSGEGLIWGFLALLIFVFIVVSSLYMNIPYKVWKLIHKGVILAFIFTLLHIMLTPASLFKNFALPASLYIYLLFALATLSYLLQVILKRKFFVKKFKILGAKALNGSVLEVSAENSGLKYRPGQYAFVSFNAKGFREFHPFSFVSSPDEKEIKFAIKALGDYTKALRNLDFKCCKELYVEGPYGGFDYSKYKDKKQIWIAGGIGITPFVSMAKDLKRSKLEHKATLYYSVKSDEDFVYLDELKSTEGLNVVEHLSSKLGFLSIDKIMRDLNIDRDSINDYVFLVCAPPAMIDSLRKQALARGLDKKNFVSEEFSF